MKTAEEIISDVKLILNTKWLRREGRQVPDSDSVTLGNDAVTIEGTVLYADMADSTGLVNGFKDWFAAEVYKSYLVAACHVIRNNSGEITAFDGDRVMAVYHGDRKNTAAARTALQLNWMVQEVNGAVKSAYPNTAFELKHAVGVDTSNLFVAKTGIRNSNDLVWVGRAANYAAKLASLPGGAYGAFITDDVFTAMNDETKYGGNPRKLMWDKLHWTDRNMSIHKSTWTWKP